MVLPKSFILIALGFIAVSCAPRSITAQKGALLCRAQESTEQAYDATNELVSQFTIQGGSLTFQTESSQAVLRLNGTEIDRYNAESDLRAKAIAVSDDHQTIVEMLERHNRYRMRILQKKEGFGYQLQKLLIASDDYFQKPLKQSLAYHSVENVFYAAIDVQDKITKKSQINILKIKRSGEVETIELKANNNGELILNFGPIYDASTNSLWLGVQEKVNSGFEAHLKYKLPQSDSFNDFVARDINQPDVALGALLGMHRINDEQAILAGLDITGKVLQFWTWKPSQSLLLSQPYLILGEISSGVAAASLPFSTRKYTLDESIVKLNESNNPEVTFFTRSNDSSESLQATAVTVGSSCN